MVSVVHVGWNVLKNIGEKISMVFISNLAIVIKLLYALMNLFYL